MLITLAAVMGACFGAAAMSALVAVGAKSACGECNRWRLVAAGRMADIDERTTRIAELTRQNDSLIAGAVESLDDFEW